VQTRAVLHTQMQRKEVRVVWWAFGGTGVIALIGAVACVIFALSLDRRVLTMRNTGTLGARETERLHRAGERGLRCEVAGVIECDSALSAPLSSTICVAYAHQVVEHVQRGVYSDMEDRRRNDYGTYRFSHDSTNVDTSDQRRVRFYVRDTSGRILIEPAWASIDMPRSDERYGSITGGVGSASPETVGQWHTEHTLAVGSTVYVLGYLGESYGEAALVSHPADRAQPFLISYRSEQELERSVATRSNLLYLGAGVGMVVGMMLIWLAWGHLV
jgi:hypothetical protein